MKLYINYLGTQRFIALILTTILWVVIEVITARAIFLDIILYQKIIAFVIFAATLVLTVATHLIMFFSYLIALIKDRY